MNTTRRRGRLGLHRLLWLDCTAGLCAGASMLFLSGWLSVLYALPLRLLLAMGVINMVYGVFSLSLARRATRPRKLIAALAIANGIWALVCLMLLVVFASHATAFGIAQLSLEALFVGGLGAVEWRYREQLVVAR